MRLPVVSGQSVIKMLTKQGFTSDRQSGSHISLHKRVGDKTLLVVVPLKSEIKKGTLLSIIRQSGIPREDFLKFI
jgi:predicted RNA binding protein YcfA (HicA-like mRNA interferase family)